MFFIKRKIDYKNDIELAPKWEYNLNNVKLKDMPTYIGTMIEFSFIPCVVAIGTVLLYIMTIREARKHSLENQIIT